MAPVSTPPEPSDEDLASLHAAHHRLKPIDRWFDVIIDAAVGAGCLLSLAHAAGEGWVRVALALLAFGFGAGVALSRDYPAYKKACEERDERIRLARTRKDHLDWLFAHPRISSLRAGYCRFSGEANLGGGLLALLVIAAGVGALPWWSTVSVAAAALVASLANFSAELAVLAAVPAGAEAWIDASLAADREREVAEREREAAQRIAKRLDERDAAKAKYDALMQTEKSESDIVMEWMEKYASLEDDVGDRGVAATLYSALAARCEDKYGDYHSETRRFEERAAGIRAETGDLNAARESLEKLHRGCSLVYGPDHHRSRYYREKLDQLRSRPPAR